MRILRNRKGFTLMETMTVVGIFSAICLISMLMMIAAMKSADGTSAKAYTDTDAAIAMARMVQDVREAKTVTPLDSGNRLSIIFPVRPSDSYTWNTAGYYDRHTADATSEIQYYVSDNTGLTTHTGTWLWRKTVSNGNTAIVKRDIGDVTFIQDTLRSIKITILASNSSADGTKQTQLTSRVVYLRNY